MALTQNSDFELCSQRRQIGLDHRQREAFPAAPAIAARGCPADQRFAVINRLGPARIGIGDAVDFECNQRIGKALALPFST